MKPIHDFWYWLEHRRVEDLVRKVVAGDLGHKFAFKRDEIPKGFVRLVAECERCGQQSHDIPMRFCWTEMVARGLLRFVQRHT